ncbi:uncharacterized protein LOC142219950 [Haematobia irritans]|uniref:uncharacterized protein LOC142219950 n=1 Tax=Haematobia irritans TaxID=7368 RepID=UPI003F4FF297
MLIIPQVMFLALFSMMEMMDCDKSSLQTFHDRVLKRRIRSVVFPQKAQLLLTPAFGKAILGGRPRGLGYSIEFDMYNPLPDTVEGWKPTILLKQIENKKTSNKAEPMVDEANNTNTVPSYPEYYEAEFWHGMDMYQFPFHDEPDIPLTYYHSKVDKNPMYLPWRRHNTYVSTKETISPNVQQFHKRPFREKPTEDYPKFNSEKNSKSDWYLKNQNYRERRQIFDQLETIGRLLKFDMKSCIKRAMCEITTKLKPYGASLMDDIIRIILTIPPTFHNNDEYRHRYEHVNCAHRFSASCPYRVVEFLTNTFK